MNLFGWNVRTRMPSRECRRVARILGEGSPVEAERVERHLDVCRGCGFEAEALAALKDAVRRHGAADASAKARLQVFADRLASGEIDPAAEPSS